MGIINHHTVVRICLLLTGLIVLSGSSTEYRAQVQTLLDKGLQAEQEGHFEEALSIWLRAKFEEEVPSAAIGRNYIRLVTEQGMKDYYQAASAMYVWGLSAGEIDPNRPALEQELAFMEPVLSEKRFKHWKTLLEQEDPGLYERMRLWWQVVDPTPATPYNERLIEHWERIAHSRRNFTRTEESVYGTDERGPVYVRYGKPDRKFTGHLQLTVQDAIDILGNYNASNLAIANAAVDMFNAPYYEIWVYLDETVGMRENLVMMFGDKPLGGFDRLITVEDLIPSRGFTFSRRYDYQSMQNKLNGLPQPYNAWNPAMVLQWAYYDQLKAKDHYFADIFTKMAMQWKDLDGAQRFFGGQYKQKHLHITLEKLNKAPKENSTHKANFPDIPLDIYQYRLLDENNKPVFATILQSRPQQAFLEDLSVNQNSMFEGNPDFADTLAVQQAFRHYRLVHGLRLTDPDGRLLSRERIEPVLVLDGDNMQAVSGSAFTVPYVSGQASQVFYAELHNRHPETRPLLDTPFPDYLRGLGKKRVNQPEPLDPDPAMLQLSDLILGYQKNETKGRGNLFPFVVTPERQIPEGEPLVLHYEVYHLDPRPDGTVSFLVDYEIRPVNFLGWTREQQDALTVSLQFEHDRTRYAENLEIEATNLEPGKYVLRLKVADRVSGQEKRREVHFEVLE